MAYSNQTIHDMFDTLQSKFGEFQKFEDVPASVLKAEITEDAQLGEFSSFAHEAAA